MVMIQHRSWMDLADGALASDGLHQRVELSTSDAIECQAAPLAFPDRILDLPSALAAAMRGPIARIMATNGLPVLSPALLGIFFSAADDVAADRCAPLPRCLRGAHGSNCMGARQGHASTAVRVRGRSPHATQDYPTGEPLSSRNPGFPRLPSDLLGGP